MRWELKYQCVCEIFFCLFPVIRYAKRGMRVQTVCDRWDWSSPVIIHQLVAFLVPSFFFSPIPSLFLFKPTNPFSPCYSNTTFWHTPHSCYCFHIFHTDHFLPTYIYIYLFFTSLNNSLHMYKERKYRVK